MLDNYETTTTELCAGMGNAFDAFEDAISERHPDWRHDAVQSAAADAMRQAIGWED